MGVVLRIIDYVRREREPVPNVEADIVPLQVPLIHADDAKVDFSQLNDTDPA